MDQTTNLQRLRMRLDTANGADRRLGGDLLLMFSGEIEEPDAKADPTASVEAAVALIGRALPGWRWHVGYSANGVTPYAILRENGNANGARSEATAPTVPLALLRALIKALETTR